MDDRVRAMSLYITIQINGRGLSKFFQTFFALPGGENRGAEGVQAKEGEKGCEMEK